MLDRSVYFVHNSSTVTNKREENKMHDARYIALSKEAAKIRSANLRDAVEAVIDAGWVNANDTVFTEKRRTVADWDYLFVGTITFTLSNMDANRHVDAWFAKHSITF
jgi:hypothetical protein